MRKPGAADTLLRMRSAPLGMRAMRSRASFMSFSAIRVSSSAARARIDVDRDAERLGDAVGGDVVVGRPDAAGGEHIGVAVAQRVERGDDLVLDIGHHADLAHVDADVGQILGDIADVLVLGAPGQDFVADHQDCGGDDVVLAPVVWAPVMSFIGPLPAGFRCSAATDYARTVSGSSRRPARPPISWAFPPPLPGRHRHRYNRTPGGAVQ